MAGHRLGVLLWIYVCMLDGVAGTCTAGQYGSRCSYQCHCPQAKCDPTSGCQPQDCSTGWSGPTCQKENIALNKTTTSSDGYTLLSSNAVNGDTRGDKEQRCILSAYNDASITSAWWRVDLGQKTLIHDVIIYFRNNYNVRRNGIQIYIADTAASPTDGANCYNVTGNNDGTDIPDVLNVTCSVEGRYLVLYTTTVNNDRGHTMPIMDFCEVEVNVCGPGTFGTNCSNYCHCEGKLCNSVNGVCPSGVCRPGWKMDKCDTACDDGSYGTNCTQICSNRNCKGDSSSCNHVTGKCPGGCKAGWAGTDCKQVCGVGSYGTNCTQTCSIRNCKGDNSSCDNVAGMCVEGCTAGWNGTDCAEECVHSYGEDCSHQCSSRNCSGTSSCNHVTGQCENGCRPGWKNIDCTVACVQGLEYSAGCGGNCSARMCKGGTGTCPRDTGRCESGCQSGWKGEDCSTVCSRGTYGANCSGKCGQCRHSKACHHVNGTCPSGCIDGWTDHHCKEVCSRGTYGANCTGKCGQCRDSKTCHHVNSTCPNGCIDGWTDHHCKQETKNNNPPLIHSISLIIGLVVGVVITLLLGGAVHLYLLRKGGLAWTRGNVKDGDRRDTADPNMTPADNYTSISELPRTDGRNTQDNDYAGLDTDTRTDDKHYDVIQNKVYVNT